MKIGVYDSGVGGKSVAEALHKAYPEHEVIFIDDAQHMPYGTKSEQELLVLAKAKLAELEKQQCDIVVVACNTISCTVLKSLSPHMSIPTVGIVPMIKPASNVTVTRKIAVCATPRTLASARYKELLDEFAQDIEVIEPDCSTWASMIQENDINETLIKHTIDDVCARGADVIVLGCTHYHWIHEMIKRLANGKATVLYPEEAIIRRVGYVAKEIARTVSMN